MKNTNKTLFAGAIADAKAMREVALENAKQSLHESLNPRLQSMLNMKLQEMEDEELDESVELDENNSEELEEEFDMNSLLEDDEIEEGAEPIDEADEAEDDDESDEADGDEDVETVEDDVDVKDLSLEDLKTLIQDMISQEVEAAGIADDDEMGDDMIPTDDFEGGDEMGAEDEFAGEEEDGEINIDELLAELDDELNEGDDEIEEGVDQNKEDLKEALKTINTLRVELKEVNLLNAKLIYVNKIFKKHNLNESQKIKLIGTFDKAETVKEAKIIYETLNIPSSKNTKAKTKTRLKENLSLASKTVTGTRRLNESKIVQVDFISRFQKLANIK
jgi:hypothetical protein